MAPPAADTLSYVKGIEKFRAERIETLTKPDNWLALVGYQPLKQGTNTIGGSSNNDIVINSSHAHAKFGVLTISGEKLSFVAEESAEITDAKTGKKVVGTIALEHDDDGRQNARNTVLKSGKDIWFQVILRRTATANPEFALRVKDAQAPALKAFKGIPTFPVDPTWKIEGRFEPFASAKKQLVESWIGSPKEKVLVGQVKFSHGGQAASLDVGEWGPGGPLVVLFKDGTNGKETYKPVRVLRIERPAAGDASNKVEIDFNKAINLPCAFSVYATCPYAPLQNWLPFRVEAGEKTPYEVLDLGREV